MAFVHVLQLAVHLFIWSHHGCITESDGAWVPTGLIQCLNNTDCGNERLCCSITPALGRRRQFDGLDPDGNVHYCLPWKDEHAAWCELHHQYSPDAPNYYGLCPCGPGLVCTPTHELDEKYYPRDIFGKCTPV
ncbi:hypothetical protein ACJMK2_044086 [Sinanodonta woodiana]|uniref:Prokineticin domain-containing protein n=1 Tax=Sinanodonta woodiana TaxID=1069815 RepID=A0ABD3VYW8_SINWO